LCRYFPSLSLSLSFSIPLFPIQPPFFFAWQNRGKVLNGNIEALGEKYGNVITEELTEQSWHSLVAQILIL